MAGRVMIIMLTIPALIVLIVFGIYEQIGLKSLISQGEIELDGNFVVMMLDSTSKPTKYWILESTTIDQYGNWISFEEKDGEMIHISSSAIVKEYENPSQLVDIKQEYGLK
jgi:hypothetical protein